MANLIDYKDRPREILCEVFDDFVELYIGDNAQETKIYLTLKEFDKLTKQVIMAKDDEIFNINYCPMCRKRVERS